MDEKRYRGTVKKRKFAESSKSEHQAVMLDTGKAEYKLRRIGGNPFADVVLDDLVGCEVECVGVQRGTLLIIQSWKETRSTGAKEAGSKSNSVTKKDSPSIKSKPKKSSVKGTKMDRPQE